MIIYGRHVLPLAVRTAVDLRWETHINLRLMLYESPLFVGWPLILEIDHRRIASVNQLRKIPSRIQFELCR